MGAYPSGGNLPGAKSVSPLFQFGISAGHNFERWYFGSARRQEGYRMYRGIVSLTILSLLMQVAVGIDSMDILPPHKLRPGMKGYGLSVFRGTQIERFPITVLGVLERTDFDMDLILIRVEGGTVIRRKSGIIAGMSGSPVFVRGKLIGAIAFAWAFSKEPIAGVTPITAMLACTDPKRFPSPRLTTGTLRPRDGMIRIKGRLVRRVWVVPNPSEAKGLRGRLKGHDLILTPVTTPLIVRGLSRPALRLLRQLLEPYNFLVVEGVGGNVPVGDAPIRPGSALGVQIVGGDVSMTAVGTVTWVEGDKILAFGHPMFQFGSLEIPVTSAYILDILPSQVISFKLAVSLKEKGRLTQDRAFAVAGELGRRARTVPMTLTLQDFAQRLQRRYTLKLASHRELLSLGAYLGLAGALFTHISPAEEGSTHMRLRVEAEGLPPIVRENWFPNESQGLMGSLLFLILGGARTSPIAELADILEAVQANPFGEVRFTKIVAQIAFYPERRTAWIDRVTARRTRVKPGDKVPVTLTLKGWGGFERTLTVDLEVPDNARPGRMRFYIGGGMMGELVRRRAGYRRPRPRSLKDLWEQLRDVYANNEVLIATTPLTSGVEIAGKRWETLPTAIVEALMSMGSSDITPIRDYREKRFSFDRILRGVASITLRVEAEEKEKESPPRLPTTPSRPGQAPPSSPRPRQFEGQDFGLSLRGWRWLLLPLTRAWKDPAERAWWEISVMRQRWGQGNESFFPWIALNPFRMQRQERLERERPPEPPPWEEVQRLSPEEMGRKSEEKPAPTKKPPKKRTKALARPPKKWVLEKGKDWLKGKLDGTIVTTDGKVTLGYHNQLIYDPKDTISAFCLLPIKDSLYIGTVGPARLLCVREGEMKRIVEVQGEVAVTALAQGSDGSLWFATAPTGKVFRIPKGAREPDCVVELEATVWALAVLEGGKAIAATGPKGKLFLIDPIRRRGRVLVQLPERHLTALAVAPDGSVYFGTNPRGKVYRLTKDGKIVSVFECPKNPVQALAVDGKGNLYVGTSGSAIVYLIRPDGRWEELYRFKPERHIMAMRALKEGVLVATGSPGKLYRLTPDGVAAWLYDSKQPHLLTVALMGEDICFVPSGSGEVLKLVRNRRGIYLSPVLDAGQVARWGIMKFVAEVPEGGMLWLQSRSGNTAYPDETWSDWNKGYVASGQEIESPPGRYLQLRVLFIAGGDGKAPTLKRVEVLYLPKNRRPHLTLREPKPGSIISGRVTIRWQGKDPDKDRLIYEVYYSRDGKDWRLIRPAPQKKAKRGKGSPAPPYTTQTRLTWDTTKVADGTYSLKVVASDRLANPDDPRSDEEIIAPLIVDNTPPVLIWAKRERKGSRLFVTAYDNTTLGSAEYRPEGGEWIAATCADGVFDEPYETLIIDLHRLPVGTKVLEIRLRDAAGNEITEKYPLR